MDAGNFGLLKRFVIAPNTTPQAYTPTPPNKDQKRVCKRVLIGALFWVVGCMPGGKVGLCIIAMPGAVSDGRALAQAMVQSQLSAEASQSLDLKLPHPETIVSGIYPYFW